MATDTCRQCGTDIGSGYVCDDCETTNPNDQFPADPSIDAVACEPTVDCEMVESCSPQCPIHYEVDLYRVTVRWRTDAKTLEKHSLSEYIQSFSGSELTQEQLCDRIYAEASRDGIADLKVSVHDERHHDLTVER